jgi:hypothetical protein
MSRFLAAGLALAAFAACHKADPGDTTPDASGSGATADAFIPETVTDVSTDVTADTTWTGLVKVHGSIKVAAGVTLTIEAGTVVQLDTNVGITVNGTVNANGIKGKLVHIQPAPGTHYWSAWSLPTGGKLSLTYVVSTGGGVTVSGGSVTARDSELSNVTHDLLVVSNGTVDFQYSWIGMPQGQTDTTHCDMHFEGGNPQITVSHSNLSTATYGVMFYAGQNADFTSNNWFSNGKDMDKFPAASGDISGGYFAGGNPTSSGLTANAMATSMVADAGPR